MRGAGRVGDSVERTKAVSIVEALGDMVWVRDARTRELLYVSSNARDFLGLSADVPYTSDSFISAVHPDDRWKIHGVMDAAAGTVEFRFFKHGELRWGEGRVRHVYDDTGAPVRVEGFTTDVTERVRREDALRAETRRAETLSRVAEKLSGTTRLDEAMRLVCEETAQALDASTVSVQLYAPATGELVGCYAQRSDGAAIDTPEAAPYAVLVEGFRARGAISQIVDVLAVPDLLFAERMRTRGIRSVAFAAMARMGELLGILSVVSYDQPRELSASELAMLKGIADQAVGSLVNARLFAEKEEAEAKLRASEKRYREIVEATHEGIGVADATGRVTYCNPRLAEILDLTPAEVMGRHFLEVLGIDDPEAAKRRFAARLEGQSDRTTTNVRTHTGRNLWLAVTSTVVGEGGKDGILTVVSDVTETRRLAEKLQNAQKAESLGVLAGGVAHDFNNLLVSMLGNAGFALLELPPESPVRNVIEDIQTAARRASELTRQLLAYSGRGRFVLGRLDLGKVVGEMTHLLSAVISKNVILKYSFAKSLPPIEGDPTQIRQIVMNLITNASDAIGERSGIVTVATSLIDADRAYLADTFLDDELQAGFYVCLEISDTGVGMTPETRAKIFDPFFSTKFTGRGLGLAAALGILRAHRGAIKVYSEVGRGTTFKVLFPAAAGAVDEPLLSVTAHDAALETGTVLVVDDDPTVRSVVKRILVQRGFEVITAPDGVAALQVYAESRDRIRAVILDVTMPVMGGEETFRRLRQLDANVRVLLTSGYSEQEATSRFAGKGLAGFLAKPFTPAELIERMRAVLEG